MRNIKLIAFSAKGLALAKKIAEKLGLPEDAAERCGTEKGSLDKWTKEHFAGSEALIFVGSVGIAVRAIAPYIVHKTEDPAVVVCDEGGNYAIPILSGHLGGANDLAREIAALMNKPRITLKEKDPETIGINAVTAKKTMQPVITTATDVNEHFSIDSWARIQGFEILNPQRIKEVSSKILEKGRIILHSDYEIEGERPEDVRILRNFDPERCDAYLMDPFNHDITDYMDRMLLLMPKINVLGIGCRKGATFEQIEEAFIELLYEYDFSAKSILSVASIDLKRNEPGLREFVEWHGYPIFFYSAERLKQVLGDFSASAFVEKTTGVDNVCERAAVMRVSEEQILRFTEMHDIEDGMRGVVLDDESGLIGLKEAEMAITKFAHNGVTMALAVRKPMISWKWKYE